MAAKRSLLLRPVVPLIVLGIWTWLARHFATALFPSPAAVAAALWDWVSGATGQAEWYSGHWAADAAASALRILTGLLIGAAAAVPLGVLVGWSRVAGVLLDSTIQLLRPISVVAWIPVAIFIFGLGNRSAVFLVSLATFFPVYVSTVQAVRFAERRYTAVARMLGAGTLTLLWRVVLPMARVGILAGIRVAVGLAWAVVTVAEMLAVKSGLGHMLWDSYYNLRVDLVFAGMLSLGLLGFVTDRIVVVISRRSIRYAEELGLGH